MFTPQATFVVDDVAATFCMNKGNGIEIPRFTLDVTCDAVAVVPMVDTALWDLEQWLSSPKVMQCADVQMLEKGNIFGQSQRESCHSNSMSLV